MLYTVEPRFYDVARGQENRRYTAIPQRTNPRFNDMVAKQDYRDKGIWLIINFTSAINEVNKFPQYGTFVKCI